MRPKLTSPGHGRRRRQLRRHPGSPRRSINAQEGSGRCYPALAECSKSQTAQCELNQTQYGQYIVAARQSFAQKNYDAAGKYAAEALKLKPGDAEATKIVSDSHAALNPAKDTATTPPTPKNTAKVDPPSQPKPEPTTDASSTAYNQYIAAARQTFAQKNYDMAGKYAAEALKYKPGDAEATKIVNDSHAAMTAPKDTATANQPKPEPKADMNTTNYNQYIAAARQKFAEKNYDHAGQYAAEALKYKPGDAEATKIVNDSHAAMNPAKDTAKVDPPSQPKPEPKADASATAYNQYIAAARQTFAQKNYDMAGKYASEALKNKPGDAEATKIVNDSQLALKNAAAGRTVPLDNPPVKPETDPKADANLTAYNQYIAAARQTFAQKNYDMAGKYAAEALKHKPGDAEATKIVNDSHAAMAKAPRTRARPRPPQISPRSSRNPTPTWRRTISPSLPLARHSPRRTSMSQSNKQRKH